MTYQGVDPRDGRRRRDRGPMSTCDPSPVMRSLYISIVVAVFAGCPAAQHQPPRPPVRVAREPIIPGPVAPTAPPAAAPSQAAADTPTAAASTALITLPLLDAMFADPGFASEIKARLGLSDEQIEQIRGIARTATAGLRERADGSTLAASRDADQKLAAILSDTQRDGLARHVAEHWSRDEDGVVPPWPALGELNGIPSDTRVVINAPAYRMDIFRDGELLRTYRIGIGYPEFPLPTGLRKATSIIYNPSWTPPDEPWVKGKFAAGRRVAAGSELNPLGPIKIPIGMPSLIHGGKPASSLGGFDSHGCVGLTDRQVREFAGTLAEVSNTPITPEAAAGYADNPRETRRVKLVTAVPVELRYETIVVVDGKLFIYRDVYERGTNTEQHVREVLQANGVSFDLLSEPERLQISRALRQMGLDAAGKAPGLHPDDRDDRSGAVTRRIKGAREMVINLDALKGRGYPAPLRLSKK